MITARTRVYGLIGNPVEKSLSPILQNAWLQDHGIDAVYVALRAVDAASLAALGRLGVAGVNVTVPYKSAAYAAAATADPIATALQAANVLRFAEDGAAAFNTDAPGFECALDARWPHWRRETRAAILVGAGGAAAAVAYALARHGVSCRIINRTFDKAAALAAAISPHATGGATVDADPWDALKPAMQRSDLIINAVTDDAAVNWDFTNSQARCVDLRYGAMASHFLASARRANLDTMDGLGMLIHQGALAFTHWFGVSPDVDIARIRLEAALA